MQEAINSILQALGWTLSPWVGPALALGLMVVFMPAILRNFKISRARKILQRSRIMQPKDKILAGQAALRVVGKIPMGLVAVADEALRQERRFLAHEAVKRLMATGQVRDHARRLVRILEDDGGPGSAEELALLVERLAKTGLLSQAVLRLEKGMQRWPKDPGLRDWQVRLKSEDYSAEHGVPYD
jgi:hypothetical protein